MKIEKIKKLKNGKYKIILDDGMLTTYDSVILDNNLLFKKQIDQNTLNEIESSNNYYDVYNKVIKMVSNKLRSEEEIRQYLENNNLEQSEIEKMVTILKNENVINDVNFTKAFIHDKISFSNDGPLKIKNLLRKHNIDDTVIDNELSKIDSSVFHEKIKKMVNKKMKNNHKYSNNNLRFRLTSELNTLGFDNFNINDYFIEQNNDELINKEAIKLYNKLSKKYEGYDLQLHIKQKLYQKGFDKEDVSKAIENIDNLK